MKYYVVVELRDYNGVKIGESSCTCEEDISDESLAASARIAGELMAKHHTGIKMERMRNRVSLHHYTGGALVCDCAGERKLTASSKAPAGWPGPVPSVVNCGVKA